MFKGSLNIQYTKTIIYLIILSMLSMVWFLLFKNDVGALIIFEIITIVFIAYNLSTLNAIYKYYNKVFQFESPDAIERQFSYDKASGQYVEFGRVVLTPNYIYTKQYGFGIHQSRNLMMAHKKTATRRVHGIKVSRKYYILLYFSDNTIDEVRMSEAEVDQLMAYLQAYYPTVVIGFMPKLVMMFRKDFNRFYQEWINRINSTQVQN